MRQKYWLLAISLSILAVKTICLNDFVTQKGNRIFCSWNYLQENRDWRIWYWKNVATERATTDQKWENNPQIKGLDKRNEKSTKKWKTREKKRKNG